MSSDLGKDYPLSSSSTNYLQNMEDDPMQLSSFESLSDDLLWDIFDIVKEPPVLARLSASSRRFKVVIDNWASFKLKIFDRVIDYLPRTMTPEEKRLPLLQQLDVARKIAGEFDHLGRTPLIKATIASKIKPEATRAMSILIALGAEIDQRSLQGRTASDYAEYWKIQKASSLIRELRNSPL